MSDDLLPPNATPLERAISSAGARMLSVDTDAIRRERQPANCSAQFVPLLAWERSIRCYSPTDEAGNRARIATAFEDHTLVGTPPRQEAEIAFDTGQNVRIVEYFEERDLVWPDFVAESVINPGDPAPDLDALMAAAVARRDTRDWPKVRTRVVQPPAVVNVGAAHSLSIRIATVTLLPPPAPYVGAAHRLMPQYRIPPL